MKDQIGLVKAHVSDVNIPIEFNQIISAESEEIIAEVYLRGSILVAAVDVGTTVGLIKGKRVTVPCDFSSIVPGGDYTLVFRTAESGVIGKAGLLVYAEDGFTAEPLDGSSASSATVTLISSGDGTKFLSDDGEYKTIAAITNAWLTEGATTLGTGDPVTISRSHNSGDYTTTMKFADFGDPDALQKAYSLTVNDTTGGGTVTAFQHFSGPLETATDHVGITAVLGAYNNVDSLSAQVEVDSKVGAIVFRRQNAATALGWFKGAYYDEDVSGQLIGGQEDRWIPDRGYNDSRYVLTANAFAVTNEANNRIITSLGVGAGGNAEANLVFDGTNLGIGTTSPAFKLVVSDSGNSGFIAGFFNDAGDTDGNGGSDTDESLLWVGGLQNELNYGVHFGAVTTANSPSEHDSDFIIKTNSSTGTGHTEKFRVTHDGNVGIGTSSPTAPLSINKAGTGAIGSIQMINPSTPTGSTNQGAHIVFGDNADSFRGWVGFFDSSTHGSGTDFNIKTDGDIQLAAGSAAGVADVFISSSGNVGIGTTSPTQAVTLERNTNAALNSEVYNSNAGTAASAGFLARTVGNNFSIVSYADAHASKANINELISSATGSHVVISTESTERLRVTSTGNVGIGTTSPLTFLDVKGTVSSNYLSLFQAQTGNTSANGVGISIGSGATAGHALRLIQTADGTWTGASQQELFEVTYNGNVGIGTSSPSQKLDIEAASGNALVDINAQSGGVNENAGIRLQKVGSNLWSMLTNDDDDFRLYNYTTGADQILLDVNGNVGIGTASPATPLNVIGTGGIRWQYTDNTVNAKAAIDAGSSTANPALKLYRYTGTPNTYYAGHIEMSYVSGAVGQMNFRTAASAAFGSESLTTRMTIANSGGIGMGTAVETNVTETLVVDNLTFDTNTISTSTGALNLDAASDYVLANADVGIGNFTANGPRPSGDFAAHAEPNFQMEFNGATIQTITRSDNGAFGPVFGLYKNRSGNIGSGQVTAVQDGDGLGTIFFGGADGVDHEDGAAIAATVDGTVSTNIVPTKLEISTQNTSGTRTVGWTMGPDGGVFLGTATGGSKGIGTMNATRYYIDGASRNDFFGISEPSFQIEKAGTAGVSIVRNSNNTNGPELAFGKTRGASLGAVTAATNGDALGTIYFYGAEGDQLRQAASIRAEVEGAVANDIIPGRIVFSTTTTSGTFNDNVSIEPDGGSIFGSATGGSQGAGTINAEAIYVNGVAALTDLSFGSRDGQIPHLNLSMDDFDYEDNLRWVTASNTLQINGTLQMIGNSDIAFYNEISGLTRDAAIEHNNGGLIISANTIEFETPDGVSTRLQIDNTGDFDFQGNELQNFTTDKQVANLYVSSGAASNAITATTYLNLLANSTVANAGQTTSNFTIDNVNKRITYTGTTTIKVEVTAAVSLTSTKSTEIARFRLAKNGTTDSNSQQSKKIGTGSDLVNVSILGTFSLATNDYIELFATLDASTSDTITPVNCYIQVFEFG